MGLEEGSVNDLSIGQKFTLTSGLPELCLQQMLSALDFLAHQEIVHRDVKPDNILFSKNGPEYHFRLADFGVGKLTKYAYSCQGTNWCMAPEILKLRNRSDSDSRIRERQSPKVDVWSLFVAIAHARGICNYRERNLDTNDEILDAAREARKEPWMSKYFTMAIEDPAYRASALDILNRHFNGVGAWKSNDVKMTENNVELLMDSPAAQATQHAALSILPRRNLRYGRPSRIEKNKSPCFTGTRIHTT